MMSKKLLKLQKITLYHIPENLIKLFTLFLRNPWKEEILSYINSLTN